jgi:hypothetical protein
VAGPCLSPGSIAEGDACPESGIYIDMGNHGGLPLHWNIMKEGLKIPRIMSGKF